MLNFVALDRIFDALGDPTRRWIVEVLCDGEDSVGRLAEPWPLSLATILQHVKVLEQSGLIHTQKVGRQRICRIEPQALRLLDEWVTPRRRVWDTRVFVEMAARYRLRLNGISSTE
jgi:DNA-binding transcriptional ArsR family regulator